MICHAAWVAKAAGISRSTGRQVDSVSSCKSSGHSAGICSKKVKPVQPSRPSQWSVGRMFRQDENSIKHECSCLAWKSMKQYLIIYWDIPGASWCDSSLLHISRWSRKIRAQQSPGLKCWTQMTQGRPSLSPSSLPSMFVIFCHHHVISCPSVLLNLHHHPRPDLLTNLVPKGRRSTKPQRNVQRLSQLSSSYWC